MSDEQDPSSNTGMIVAIILGGVVLVLLLLGGLGAAAWFFMADVHAEHAEAIAEMEVKAMEVEAAVKDLDAAVKEIAPPAGPLGNALDERLIGVWESKSADTVSATLEFQETGALLMSATLPRQGKVETRGRWRVERDQGGAALKLVRTTDEGPATHSIQFLDDNRFSIEGPGGKTVYERRKK